MGLGIAISRIKIHTRRMPNVSWVDLLGKRRQLKRAIAEVVTGSLPLFRELQARGVLKIEELEVEARRTGISIEPTLMDILMYLRRKETNQRYVTGFRFGDQSYDLPSPVYLGSEKEVT